MDLKLANDSLSNTFALFAAIELMPVLICLYNYSKFPRRLSPARVDYELSFEGDNIY